MFEALGYEFCVGVECIYYIKSKNFEPYVIIFNDDKTITKKRFYSTEFEDITCAELKAINQQCKELGWF